MYLLYTKKSVNPYSLVFSILNTISSALWISYAQMVSDTPLLIRGSSDLVLFTISAIYILRNRLQLNTIQPIEYPSNKVDVTLGVRDPSLEQPRKE